MTARAEDGAAGVVERQRQAERLSDFHLRDALQHFFRREEIESATFVIDAIVAPSRASGAVGPAWVVGHDGRLPIAYWKGAAIHCLCRGITSWRSGDLGPELE